MYKYCGMTHMYIQIMTATMMGVSIESDKNSCVINVKALICNLYFKIMLDNYILQTFKPKDG